MDPVYVRPFNKEDRAEAKLFVEWLYAGREKNRFDPELFKRGQAVIFTLFDKSGIVGFVPVTAAFIVESLAFRPGLHPVREAKALEAFQHLLVHRAAEAKVPDAYFVTKDETVLRFAGHYGWGAVDVPLLNLHFASLERQDEDNN